MRPKFPSGTALPLTWAPPEGVEDTPPPYIEPLGCTVGPEFEMGRPATNGELAENRAKVGG